MAVQDRGGTRSPSGDGPPMVSEASISEIRLPLVALGLLRASEAIAWTSIFPYVYPMIKFFPGVDETDIPFYAGLLVAVFTFCEFLSGMLWAKLSDRIGRRTTLLIGPLCGMVASLILGVSRSLALAIASRAFGGLFNPNVGLVQTCVVELIKRKEQRAKALAFVTFLRYMGNLIGPVIGGFLADPAALYPSLFPANSAWTTYQYLLPNLAVAVLQTITFITAFLFLPETHPQLSSHLDLGLSIRRVLSRLSGGRLFQDGGQYTALQGEQQSVTTPRELARDDAGENEEPPYELEDVSDEKGGSRSPSEAGSECKPKQAFTTQVILQIVSVSLLAFHKVSSDAIIPTFLAAPTVPSDPQPTRRDILDTPGGFGYSNQKVGVILLSQAVIAMITQVSLVPLFINKIGSMTAYRIVLGVYPAMYLFTPLLPKLPSTPSLVFLVLDLWMKVILSSVGYICSAVLIASVVPTNVLLARVNGAAASFSCLSRSIGPVVTGKVFAVGLEKGHAGIAFWTLGAVAFLGAVEVFALREHA